MPEISIGTISPLRIPPQNIETERALLGAVMLRPDALYEAVEVINSQAFYSEKHRLVFETMLELLSKNEPIDLLSLTTRLKEQGRLESVGGASYLSELVNTVPSSTNADHYAEIVDKKHVMRELLRAAEHITGLGYDEEADLHDISEKAEKALYAVTNKLAQINILHSRIHYMKHGNVWIICIRHDMNFGVYRLVLWNSIIS